MKIVKEIGKFLVVTLLFFAVTSPVVVLFGPFDNIKRTVVGAILKSRHPQYITWLFSQDEIDKILGGISTRRSQPRRRCRVLPPARAGSEAGPRRASGGR